MIFNFKQLEGWPKNRKLKSTEVHWWHVAQIQFDGKAMSYNNDFKQVASYQENRYFGNIQTPKLTQRGREKKLKGESRGLDNTI